MDIRPRKNRETSPDRVRRCMQPKPMKPLRKVQVLYYLSRNGQLEHPHFMEVSHLANQQLRLKDVIDRLTVLRGSGMPSLFSWSCKRSYKNGYVWNDLSENDVIHPAEGAEYVLKGSEVIEGCAERFQNIHLSNRLQQTPEANFLPKRKYLLGNRNNEEEYMGVEEEEKVSNNSSFNTPNSWRSKGVSTDEIAETHVEIAETHNPKTQNNATELSLDDGSPPSSSSTLSEKTQNGSSQRFEECDSGVEPATTRHSVLLQLIACGSSITNSTKNAANVANGRKSSSLHKGVLCKTAARYMNEDDEINYMSENPRFGNPQSEEKEYFSGSIVESMTENRVSAEPALKKSSSYNEERSLKSGMAVEQLEKREEDVKGMKGKCIPRKTCCSKPQKK